MKNNKNIFLIILLVWATAQGATHAQSFEGKISYQVTYKSKMPNVSDEQLTTFMGGNHEYYINGGDYLLLSNGEYFQSLLYVRDENRLYVKTAESDTLFWMDGGFEENEVESFRILDEEQEVMGVPCKVLEVVKSTGKYLYCFNKRYKVDPNLYANHSFEGLNFVLQKTKSLLLKMVSEGEEYTRISIATSVDQRKLDQSLFKLPKGVPIQPMPDF